MYNFIVQDLFSIQRLYKDVFEKKKLTFYLCMDHIVDLEEGVNPPFGLIQL